MARVLVCAAQYGADHGATVRALETLGIDAVRARLNGSGSTGLQTPAGSFDPASQAARDYINTFDAIFILERSHITFATEASNPALNTWLQWNTASDKPVVYFGVNLSVHRTAFTPPADFPIIRPDNADLANTTALIDSGVFASFGGVSGGLFTRLGATVRLAREGDDVYVPTVCTYEGSNAYFWRLDATKHSALGANGEILATPNFPDKSFPSNTVIAYRYRNRYFLPLVLERQMFMFDSKSVQPLTLFWLLYALKLCGILPARKAVLCSEIDHPIEVKTPRLDGLTETQQLDIIYATLRWLVDFGRRTGLVVPCGLTVGSRHRASGYHWTWVNHANSAIRSRAQAINALLVAEHSGVLPCGVHDHTFTYGDVTGTFTRAGDNRHAYAAPNNVPVEHGTLVAKRVAPAGLSGTEWGDWIELNPVMSGTSQSVTGLENDNFHTARMVLSDEIDEMRELGFPDGMCGAHRYTNCASDSTGGKGYWDALIELGFRGVRAGYSGLNATSSGVQTYPGMIRGNRYRGLWFVPSRPIDWFGGSTGSYGLWYPGTNDTAVGKWGLEVGTDISADYATNAATRWKAYRRAIGCMVGVWLTMSLLWRGTIYMHPQGWFGADPNNPTGVVDTGSDLKVNPVVEVFSAMEAVQQVLSDYLRFGSPTDVMDLLDEVGFWG